jgi:hypothetical protein
MITKKKNFTYEFGGRFAMVDFKETNGQTEVFVIFDPENENSIIAKKRLASNRAILAG